MMNRRINGVDNIRPSELNGVLIVEFDVHYEGGYTQSRYASAYHSSTTPAELMRDVTAHIEYGLRNQEALVNYGDVRFW